MKPNACTAIAVFRFLIIIVVSIISGIGCETETPRGEWAGRPIYIDGDMSDWEGYSLRQFEKHGAEIAVCNDSDNFYVMLRFDSPRWPRLIRMAGIRVWFSPDADSGRTFGLKFNGAPKTEWRPPEGRFELNEEQRRRRDQRMQEFLENNPVVLTLIDNRNTEQETIVDEDDESGPKAACDQWLDYIVYEFKMPLSLIAGYDKTLKLNDLSIGLEWADREEMRRIFGRGDRPPVRDTTRAESERVERPRQPPGGEWTKPGIWFTSSLAGKP